MTDGNDSVFTNERIHIVDTGESERVHRLTCPSLTKREYLAAMAMQGLIASIGQHDVAEFHDIASDAVGFADALIAALNKETK